MANTWLITGTSTGLGRLLTEHLLARGDRVVATLRRDGALDDLQTQYGEHLHVVNFDVTDTQAMRKGVAQAFAAFGRIDVVVSNAGYGVFGAAEEATDEQIERQIATNLTGSIQLIRAVLPYLREQEGGRIVQVSSEGGQITYPCFSLYHASKWGIEGFVESVAQEVAPWGIDFIIAEPGPTATQFADALDRTQPMPLYEETPAGEIRRGLASGAFTIKGDAAKNVNLIIETADMPTPPLRLALGGTAYHSIHNALMQRMSELEANKQLTLAADSDAFIE
ncbi:SDR family oxidoreductase [Halomonas sp. ISL-60]|uniref:SDR family oxidoreductase n=1 Tax=Halomonas sp. ISL-56 TaxID=2819149 RepID=UPI001BE9C11B|nr:SDR family oxidoreductase [Halomonas sp. ISL-56]MBT2772036.1 SDR family oxidoreductase [Halomonas sp. ISL-60]MBT2800507.1 SDR family oxidoreductase [Halomonas sp. ISL-56]